MYELKMEQTLNASAEAVFKAWIDPNLMKKWYAPGEMTVPEVSSDPVENGSYRIVMQDKDGAQHIVGGQYKLLKPHTDIEFTWQWEGSPNVTKVAIHLTAVADNETHLSLHHTEFVEEGFRDHHKQGWTGCLANLPKAFI